MPIWILRQGRLLSVSVSRFNLFVDVGAGGQKNMIQLKVNGTAQSFNGAPEMPLLWYLRDILGLTGSKFGCGIGLCGACTVHVEGQATRSCVTTMQSAAGKEVTTVEGLQK